MKFKCLMALALVGALQGPTLGAGQVYHLRNLSRPRVNIWIRMEHTGSGYQDYDMIQVDTGQLVSRELPDNFVVMAYCIDPSGNNKANWRWQLIGSTGIPEQYRNLGRLNANGAIFDVYYKNGPSLFCVGNRPI